MPRCVDPDSYPDVLRARQLLSTYDDMEELIRLGAYRAGTNAEVDEAIHFNPMLEAFLAQSKGDPTSLEDGYARLARILNEDDQSECELEE